MAGNTTNQFNAATENSWNWSIRFGSEPIDLHLAGKGSKLDRFFEQQMGVTGGIGSVFNHNYIEVMNPQGEVVKRVHGLGLDQNWQMSGAGRLVGMVVDGKYTPFSEDPIQRDDPHATKPNQLQHAGQTGYTQTMITGNERRIMGLYGGLVRATIEINNQDPEFGLMGQQAPNSNSFNSEMREKLNEMLSHLGIHFKKLDAPGWSIGENYDMKTSPGKVVSCESITDFRTSIDELEKAAADQLKAIKQNLKTDVETPVPTASCPVKPN